MGVREFVTAVEKAEEENEGEEPLVFKLDGRELKAWKPTEGQFALLIMALGRHASNVDQTAGVLDFFIQVLDEESQKYVIDRMMSRRNVIDVDTIVDILEWMTEEWGGRPFQRPSGSTSSRPRGGRKSTPRTPALT